MKTPPKTTILLAIFTILTLIALLTAYTAHQNPTEQTTTETLCTYVSTATYDYTAILDPNNLIYNGKTTLKPGEGTIYTKITRLINITLTYNFQSTLTPENTQITYSIKRTLTTATIEYPLSETPQETTDQTQIQITLQPINKTETDPIITRLASEMGITSTPYYTIEITPTFIIRANTTAGPIQQIFTPKLTITFQRTDQGEITTITPLTQTRTGEITQEQTTTLQDIVLQRNASYILTTVAIAGLAFSAYFYVKAKPRTTEKPLEKLLAPHKDLIIETAEPPKTSPQTTIEVQTIQELAKTAEILAKPIILTRKPTPTLTVIDQNTVYQHRIRTQ
ncbi:MAG: DUF5305 family protein [Candidatus Bathyarchaeia archaeon]